MTQPKTGKQLSKHTPGPDERGNYWMDCGCMVNRMVSMRCKLHAQAPEMYELLEKAVRWSDGDETMYLHAIADEARRIKAAIDGE